MTFAAVIGAPGWRGDTTGLHAISADAVEVAASPIFGVRLHDVARGQALFGPACDLIRAEALVRLNGPPPLNVGLLLLGQRRAGGFETRHGSEPLLFLGACLSRMLVRWLPR